MRIRCVPVSEQVSVIVRIAAEWSGGVAESKKRETRVNGKVLAGGRMTEQAEKSGRPVMQNCDSTLRIF